MAEPSEITRPMIDAALKAAHIALYRRMHGLQIAEKNEDGHISRVTNGDSQSEQVIRDTLEKATPALLAQPALQGNTSIGYIMEETAHDFGKRSNGLNFVIDPIDGTRGYSRQDKDAPWAISIALEKNGRTIASVVYEAGENEFKTDAGGKDLPFDPAHPQGKIFWAEEGVGRGAYRMDAPAGGFNVAVAPDASYEEAKGANNLWTLKAIPAMKTDISGNEAVLLNNRLLCALDSKLELGDFKPDRDAHHSEDGVVATSIRNAVASMNPPRQVDRCLSAVTGGLKAADGRAAAFIHGNGYPWDHSAIRLILEKSGTPITEYQVPGAEGQRTVLVAGRDGGLYNQLQKTATSLPGVLGGAVMTANAPRIASRG